MSNNEFIMVMAPPGKHVITSKIGGIDLFKKETVIDLDTETGKNYYVACTVKQSFTRSRMEFTEVTKFTAGKQMEGLSVDNCLLSVAYCLLLIASNPANGPRLNTHKLFAPYCANKAFSN